MVSLARDYFLWYALMVSRVRARRRLGQRKTLKYSSLGYEGSNQDVRSSMPPPCFTEAPWKLKPVQTRAGLHSRPPRPCPNGRTVLCRVAFYYFVCIIAFAIGLTPTQKKGRIKKTARDQIVGGKRGEAVRISSRLRHESPGSLSCTRQAPQGPSNGHKTTSTAART